MNVKLGDALVIPTGWSFQFSAGPDKALKFLCHTTPPWPEEDEAVAVEHGGLGEATV
jgi:mannose-6-phosphate isomerase-like protein (cupin superfamily)